MNKHQISQKARRAIIDAGAMTDGHFVFADGDHATTKIEMDSLWSHSDSLETILELLGRAEGLPPTEVIIGVPRGGQALAIEISKRSNLPIALLERVPGGAKQDFRFVSDGDKQLALGAKSARIYEDVVTTLSSIAGVVRLLDPTRQAIHSLTIWRRGTVKSKYRAGVTDHYLVEESLPNYAPADCPVCSASAQTAEV